MEPAPTTVEELAGFGRTAPSAATVHDAVGDAEVADAALAARGGRGLVARGMARSYGDAAQRAGGDVVRLTGDDAFHLDRRTGVVTARAGVTLDRLLHHLVPRGWFVPVSPGTRLVTVGGAVASDIHGKNHHRDGSWCDHVRSLRLVLASGDEVTVGPDEDPELFWATAGGMGLTGIVVEVVFQATPITSSRLLVDTDRTDDLDEVIELLRSGDDAYDYSVAWTDVFAPRRSMGRSILTRGRFATADEVDDDRPLAYRAPELVQIPPVAPPGLLTRPSIRAFNELWYRRAPRQRRDELQTIPAFWHPLDAVGGWNHLYGPGGFVQWQMAVPDDATDALREVCRRLNRARTPSFVTVLKRFGPGNPGPLSFPLAGWTLAVDVPARTAGLGRLLDELDELVVDAGGRIYLAKDARLRRELLAAMYPRLDEWRAVRDRVDPNGVLRSDLGVRLGLC